ncbi:hypothetical protein PIB30_056580, partial [Stylosanthes scabra]|nr:hypothetical protein [Stylosanthes scabra]
MGVSAVFSSPLGSIEPVTWPWLVVLSTAFLWRMAENRPGDRGVAAASSVQIPHELPSIYRWVANDVLGVPSILDQGWRMAENRPGDRGVAAASSVQIPHELPSIYRWVANDVLGVPSILDQGYLDELKATGIIFGGGGLEQRYRVEAARRGERVCYLNLDHPTVPHWLWVNEVMFTDFGVRIPFTDFQQRLLNRASVAPSQLHPNAWASIRSFELVTEFLQLPQEPEVFLCLFKFYSSNTSGRTKKGYMS